MKTFNQFEIDEGIMDKLKAVKRGMEARGKAADHFDKAGDPKNPNASKDLRRAVKYHNVVNKEETEVSEVNDYFKRRKDEEDRIAGTKAPAKRTPKQTDYAKRRAKEKMSEGENKQIKGGDPSWKGYQMVGMKPGKGGKKVPNCVPANEGTSSLKPGWMLKKDPKLGAAMKAKIDLAKKRQGSYGNPAAGKSSTVKEDLKADLKSFRTMLEEASYKVDVEGLPTMYVQSDSPTAVKTNLRKLLRKADMIKSVDRIPDAEVKKAFRLKAMGKDEE